MPHAFDIVRYRVHKRPYSSIRAIMAEMGQSDTVLLRGLRELHNIYFDSLREDPMLFFTEDTAQLESLRAEGVTSPTMLQVLLTSIAFSDISEDDVKARWEAAMKKISEQK